MDLTPVSYYPLSYIPSVTYDQTTFDPDYINSLYALGITDYFTPSLFVTNPLFATVDTYHQNIGILQTAQNGLNEILTLINNFDSESLNSDTLNVLTSEINDIINNTTYNDINVFSQKLTIGSETVDLSLEPFNPDEMSLEDYTKLVIDKYEQVNDALKTLSFSFPYTSAQNSFDTFAFPTTDIFNTDTLTPENIDFLLNFYQNY